MATAQLPQVRPQAQSEVSSIPHGIPRVRVIVLAFIGVIALGVALDVALLAGSGLLGQMAVAVERLPRSVLVGAGVLLVAVAIPGGRWETRRLWKAHLMRVRERRIEALRPLADRLGISPLALDRVTVQMLHDLSPTDFELAMCDLLTLQGYRDVRHTGRTGDLCADLTATAPNGKHIVAQCKRYAPGNPVTSPEVQTFLGMVDVHHQVPLGLYFTTSSYTRDAAKLAADHSNRLKLYVGDELVEMVRALAVH